MMAASLGTGAISEQSSTSASDADATPVDRPPSIDH